MSGAKFETLADKLVPVAEAVFAHLGNHGYRVRREQVDYAAPFTPTMTATRSSTVLHIEVVGVIDVERLRDWVAYGKSASHDTRFALCVNSNADVPTAQVAALQKMGVGLLVLDGGHVSESVAAVDLAMSVELPRLSKQPMAVRKLLGHAYEQFARGEWREGFENACNALEEEARRYLLRWSKTGRIKINTKSGPKHLTQAEIKKLSLGQLARTFGEIVSPNSLDVTIEQALSRVNPDRVERTHRRSQKRTEERLRKNVGQHMWLIVTMLRQLTA